MSLESKAPPERVLLVDDELQVLGGLRRQLHGVFDVAIATDGIAALKTLEEEGPFAIIVSDMRMPGMNGLELLEQVQARWPEMVRIMLTGNAEQQTAVGAVNRGHVFRFINKPCPADLLIGSLEAALKQYRLQIAERELLESTLMGSVKVLTETLGLVNPAAFGRSGRLKRYVSHMVATLQLPDGWQYEAAALLSHIGCVTLSEEMLRKIYRGLPLTVEEDVANREHPLIAARLLGSIPRLQRVAQMIERLSPTHTPRPPAPGDPLNEVMRGASMLRIGVALDNALMRGLTLHDALREVTLTCQEWERPALIALESLALQDKGMEVRCLYISELRPGMILDQDVHTPNGMLLLARGQEVSISALQRLRNLGHEHALAAEAIRVQIPVEMPSSWRGANAA